MANAILPEAYVYLGYIAPNPNCMFVCLSLQPTVYLTPLIEACKGNHVELAQWLVGAGAEPNLGYQVRRSFFVG